MYRQTEADLDFIPSAGRAEPMRRKELRDGERKHDHFNGLEARREIRRRFTSAHRRVRKGLISAMREEGEL